MTQEEIKSALEILADRKLPIPARLLWVYQWLGGWLADQERVDPKNLFEGERSFYRYSALLRAKSLPPVSVTTATRVSHDCHPCQSKK